jgi:transposase-like protein
MRELSVAEQRYQAVLAVISDGLSISQVAEKVGVSRQTLLAGQKRLCRQQLASTLLVQRQVQELATKAQ